MNSRRLPGALLALLVVMGGHEALAQEGSGKTFSLEPPELATVPIFRMTSEEKIDDKPKYDYFLLVKAKLNGVYDIEGGLQESETFNVGKIDVYGTNDDPRFHMDMHQSQVRFRGQRETAGGTLVAYMEGDYWGGNKHFRLRHMWVDYKFIHFGQDWSFFGDKEIWPNVFDWDGPPSGVWRREPELKFYFQTESQWIFDIGIAQPGAQITFNPDFDDAVTAANQSVPDIIGAVWKKADFGHIRVTGIYRDLKYDTGGSNDRVAGYGGTGSGLIKTHKKWDNPIQFQFVAGKGIATYLVSFDGLNYDAAPDGNGVLEAIPTVGGWASYEHFFNERWHVNVVGGLSRFSSHHIAEFTIPGPGYGATNTSIDLKHWYGLFNIMYTPIPALTFGVEYNRGRKTARYEGTIDTGDGIIDVEEESRLAQRISFGVFFDF